MSPQLKEAFWRTLLTAFGTGGGAAAAAWASTQDGRATFFAALGAFCTPFATRFLAEGSYDTNRSRTGKVIPSDVSAQPA